MLIIHLKNKYISCFHDNKRDKKGLRWKIITSKKKNNRPKMTIEVEFGPMTLKNKNSTTNKLHMISLYQFKLGYWESEAIYNIIKL